jgi:hypothetical protein
MPLPYSNHELLHALFLILDLDLSGLDYLKENYREQLLIHAPDL